MPFSSRSPRGLLLAAAACTTALALTACGGGTTTTGAAPVPSAAPTTAPATLTVVDPWVKTADSGMTAVFGTLTATGPGDLTVVSATTSASPRTELHEVVMSGGAMTMRPKEGGFVVAPAAPHPLAPGGDHIMVMDLVDPIRAGDQVEVTLALSDGSTSRFSALAKDTTGGEESYEPMAGMSAPGGQGG